MPPLELEERGDHALGHFERALVAGAQLRHLVDGGVVVVEASLQIGELALERRRKASLLGANAIPAGAQGCDLTVERGPRRDSFPVRASLHGLHFGLYVCELPPIPQKRITSLRGEPSQSARSPPTSRGRDPDHETASPRARCIGQAASALPSFCTGRPR